MSVNHAGEVHSGSLPMGCFGEQVLILTYEHSGQAGGAVQKVWIGHTSRSVPLCGQDVDISCEERRGHGERDVNMRAVRYRRHRRNMAFCRFRIKPCGVQRGTAQGDQNKYGLFVRPLFCVKSQ